MKIKKRLQAPKLLPLLTEGGYWPDQRLIRLCAARACTAATPEELLAI
jgi:hypothetical protein